jgi:hypothetical protein
MQPLQVFLGPLLPRVERVEPVSLTDELIVAMIKRPLELQVLDPCLIGFCLRHLTCSA